MTAKPAPEIPLSRARRLWLRAQRLDEPEPFGDGPESVTRAVEHLGYVQIDTINVIERCHHHILFSRIPAYQRAHLARAQSAEKSVFEYWTHALSYVPSRDIRFFLGAMKSGAHAQHWHKQSVEERGYRKVLRQISRDGPLTIRDFDDEPQEKLHLWASKKPSKRALEHGFYHGALTVSARSGMLKTYELLGRHFGWEKPPKPAREAESIEYRLDRALRAQGLVSLDSICHLDARRKPAMLKLINARVRKKLLVPLRLEGAGKADHWAEPLALDETLEDTELAHILSPFDPLIIQRKRLKRLFCYEHLFEAYVPKEKRKLGYFALPVLIGDRIAAAADLKTDRQNRRLLVQNWSSIGPQRAGDKAKIEAELGRFERFQLGI